MDGLRAKLRGHLVRLAVPSVISLVIGGVGALVLADPGQKSFAFMNATWGLINLIICAASWKSAKPLELRPFREFLIFNVGLNLGWMMLGLPMALLGKAEVAGSGWGIALQGLILFVLDLWLLILLPKETESQPNP